ncbi:SO_0444 family Cu/Zn efflux transporter [Arcobacter sp. LA11]|uniref:SO_0444 family Cu/Zn efflux transporter n=1 Tax=Arcobacter sp. LA11 TaxID=1898176 RepID=UPI000A4035D3|nr:SO_0444 family Cu/Zn efflux transporter [Arcobacter sp. LA11]
MSYITSFFDNYFLLIDAMSIYIMVGLLFAGILKQLVPDDFVSKNLGTDSTGSIIKATIFGIPLPVCSCSVIPIAQGLRKEGASKGAVQSFLISTPITGVDSILATFSFFGLIFTIFRVLSSIIIAIAVGLVQNFLEKESIKKEKTSLKPMFSTTGTSTTSLNSFTPKPTNTSSDSSCGCSSKNEKKSFSIKKVFSYAYVTLFEDMVKALFIGLLLGAAFTTFIPKEYSSLLFENQILTYFVILLFAIPLYTCATASLPIAAAFMIQGMSAGAAFIFLTAGPATSAVTMSVVYKMLGRTSLIVYVSTIAILSLVFGFLFDSIFDKLEILNLSHHMDELSILNRTASILMLLLMFYYLLIPYFSKKSSCCSSETSCCSSSSEV